jgi:hypothetical protein
MRIRACDEYPAVSVVRGDGAMLITPCLRFFTGSSSPAFEFRADHGPAMFSRYARLIETEILLPKPKRFVRENLIMPDGYECDS